MTGVRYTLDNLDASIASAERVDINEGMRILEDVMIGAAKLIETDEHARRAIQEAYQRCLRTFYSELHELTRSGYAQLESGSHGSSVSHSILANNFNAMSTFVTKSLLLLEDTPERRTLILQRYIYLMQLALIDGDFHTYMAIKAGLSARQVHRLKMTFDGISEDAKKVLEDLESMSSYMNLLGVRRKDSTPSFVPYLRTLINARDMHESVKSQLDDAEKAKSEKVASLKQSASQKERELATITSSMKNFVDRLKQTPLKINIQDSKSFTPLQQAIYKESLERTLDELIANKEARKNKYLDKKIELDELNPSVNAAVRERTKAEFARAQKNYSVYEKEYDEQVRLIRERLNAINVKLEVAKFPNIIYERVNELNINQLAAIRKEARKILREGPDKEEEADRRASALLARNENTIRPSPILKSNPMLSSVVSPKSDYIKHLGQIARLAAELSTVKSAVDSVESSELKTKSLEIHQNLINEIQGTGKFDGYSNLVARHIEQLKKKYDESMKDLKKACDSDTKQYKTLLEDVIAGKSSPADYNARLAQLKAKADKKTKDKIEQLDSTFKNLENLKSVEDRFTQIKRIVGSLHVSSYLPEIREIEEDRRAKDPLERLNTEARRLEREEEALEKAVQHEELLAQLAKTLGSRANPEHRGFAQHPSHQAAAAAAPASSSSSRPASLGLPASVTRSNESARDLTEMQDILDEDFSSHAPDQDHGVRKFTKVVTEFYTSEATFRRQMQIATIIDQLFEDKEFQFTEEEKTAARGFLQPYKALYINTPDFMNRFILLNKEKPNFTSIKIEDVINYSKKQGWDTDFRIASIKLSAAQTFFLNLFENHKGLKEKYNALVEKKRLPMITTDIDSSFLILPVQRVPKLELLMRELAAAYTRYRQDTFPNEKTSSSAGVQMIKEREQVYMGSSEMTNTLEYENKMLSVLNYIKTQTGKSGKDYSVHFKEVEESPSWENIFKLMATIKADHKKSTRQASSLNLLDDLEKQLFMVCHAPSLRKAIKLLDKQSDLTKAIVDTIPRFNMESFDVPKDLKLIEASMPGSGKKCVATISNVTKLIKELMEKNKKDEHQASILDLLNKVIDAYKEQERMGEAEGEGPDLKHTFAKH